MDKIILKFKAFGEFSRIETEHQLYHRGIEDVIKQIREQMPHEDFVEILKTTSEEGEVIDIGNETPETPETLLETSLDRFKRQWKHYQEQTMGEEK